MGTSSGGKKRYTTFRNKQRANMSFFIVVMFFAVFGIIIFTEIFLIDERGRGGGVLVRHGSLPSYQIRQSDRADYDDTQGEDYISIRMGAAAALDDTVGQLLMGRPPAPIPIIDNSDNGESKNVVSETQLPYHPTNLTPSDGSWQKVNGTLYKFFVFSAFYDARKGQRAVRVIGATKTRGPERVWCRLWYRGGPETNSTFTSRTVPAKIKVIRENWNLKYSACFVMCPLQANQSVPQQVSVVSKVRYAPSNLLTVINNSNATRPSNKFGVCVKPLHFEYNRALQILEFIELNRILGVQHFTFYNHTIGPQVSCVMKDYVERGLVTLLPWQLNMVSQKEIRTENLFAALNDCLYRSMYKYSHVLLIDLDEFIIPRHNDTLPQLLQALSNRINTRSTASFSFQNAFFYLQWGDDESVYGTDDHLAANLVTLKKTRRRSKLHPHKQRSKYICRPELVVEAGNHFVWEFIPGHGTCPVPQDAAILHHYRICEFGGDDCVKSASTVDKTAFRYRDRLVAVVKDQFRKFQGTCKLPDPPPPPQKIYSKIMRIFQPGSEAVADKGR